MSAKRGKKKSSSGVATTTVEARWTEGQAHLANAGVELLLALRAAVSIPIDLAEAAGTRRPGEEERPDAGGWRILREVIDTAVKRLRKLGDDPTRAVRLETLATIQEVLAKEIERLEEGAVGQDVAILAQTFRSVKDIIERQMELLDSRPGKKSTSSRRARKVKVE